MESSIDIGAQVRPLAPRPMLSQTAEARLGLRHREVLDALEVVMLERGFGSATIADLAAEVSCSRRTLYEIASSKEQLVLVVLDRFLHRRGRTALATLDDDMPVAEQLRSYIRGGLGGHLQHAAYDDLTDVPAARRLLDSHYRFTMQVVERLVASGVERGEFVPTNPAVVAATFAGASLYLTQPEVVDDIGFDRSVLADQLIDYLLAGLLP